MRANLTAVRFTKKVDHWTKGRHKDHVAQYMFMIPEILFIRALHEDNRSMWYWSMPFHMGLYLCLGGLGLLFVSALLQISGLTPETSAIATFFFVTYHGAGSSWIHIGNPRGARAPGETLHRPGVERPIGRHRLSQSDLAGAHFATGFLVWLTDPGFATSRNFLVNVITFKFAATSMTGLHVINLLLFLAFWAYFPFTHMTHMVSKYFMWDKVKWDDDPNRGDAGMDARIKEYLAYPVTWAAPHIGAEGRAKELGRGSHIQPVGQREREITGGR